MKRGDVIEFGHYEQDNNLTNGKEPIEWQVLDIKDEKILLISKYGLDALPYNTSKTSITWQDSSIRKWLNSSFINDAFNSVEQTYMVKTIVRNGQYQGNSSWGRSSGGNDTEDLVFLLSYQEVFNTYFIHEALRRCKPSAYAIAKGAYTSERAGHAGWWYLRSPGRYQTYVTLVNALGQCFDGRPDAKNACIRPAIWVSLDF